MFVNCLLLLLVSCGKAKNNAALILQQSHIVASKTKLWKNGSTLKVLFLDGTEQEKELVRSTAPEWSTYGHIYFEFYELGEIKTKDAELRITFNAAGSNSFIGTDNKRINADKHTMSLSAFNGRDYYDRGTILHEFGHAIGFHHEHQHPNRPIVYNEAKLYEYCEVNIKFDKAKCDKAIKNQVAANLVSTVDFDKFSIMGYDLNNKNIDIYAPGSEKTVPLNNFLSLMDKKNVSNIYPKPTSLTDNQIEWNHQDDIDANIVRGNCRVVEPSEGKIFKKLIDICGGDKFGVAEYNPQTGQLNYLYSWTCSETVYKAIDKLNLISSTACGKL